MFYFLVLFHFYFRFIQFYFIFILFFFVFYVAGVEGCSVSIRPLTSLHPLPNIQYRKGALLCFNLLLYSVVNVWRKGVSAHLRARPSHLLLQRSGGDSQAHGHYAGQ